jgi:PAT family beta-lactamase induction signal transducer AmpG
VQRESSANPIVFAFLILPYGISNGFVSITLPFVLTSAGFSVASAAGIVALGLSANIWRFTTAPIVDLTLSLRRWYLLGLAGCVTTLLLLGFIPLTQNARMLLTVFAFISQVGACFVAAPVGGFMAHTVADEWKGRAAGWYQAGNLGGTGIGGGAGVWLASHFSPRVASVSIAASILLCAGTLRFVTDVRPIPHERIIARLRLMGRDLLDVLRSPIGLLTTVLVISPIGAAAMNNLWSAVAPDWRTDANTVALVTGVLNGLLSAVGCVVGGWAADRLGRWWAYFGSGVLLAIVAIIMAVVSRTSTAFAFGVLSYAFAGGIAYAAFSALVLYAIGKGAASTKYALLSSFGNLPVIYMTAINGWAHDRYGAGGMLMIEALLSLVCVGLAMTAVFVVDSRIARRSP